MFDREHALSLARQPALLGLSRRPYHAPRPVPGGDFPPLVKLILQLDFVHHRGCGFVGVQPVSALKCPRPCLSVATGAASVNDAARRAMARWPSGHH
jgi:hypothetical protein